MSRDLKLLHPTLQAICVALKAECAKQGLQILFTDGMRTKEEQDALYAQGRTAPGQIVTSVRYPNSMHNWGVAVDFCRNVKGREYDDSDNFFGRVAEVAKRFGLDWGGDWKSFKDKPHLQMGEYSPDGTASFLKSVYGVPENFIKIWKKSSSLFLDVPEDAWYYEALETAVKDGIIAGYEDGTFRPDEYLTRAQAASIYFREKAAFKTLVREMLNGKE